MGLYWHVCTLNAERECHERNCFQTRRSFCVCDRTLKSFLYGSIQGRCKCWSHLWESQAIPRPSGFTYLTCHNCLYPVCSVVGNTHQLVSSLFGFFADIEGCTRLVKLLILQPFVLNLFVLVCLTKLFFKKQIKILGCLGGSVC